MSLIRVTCMLARIVRISVELGEGARMNCVVNVIARPKNQIMLQRRQQMFCTLPSPVVLLLVWVFERQVLQPCFHLCAVLLAWVDDAIFCRLFSRFVFGIACLPRSENIWTTEARK